MAEAAIAAYRLLFAAVLLAPFALPAAARARSHLSARDGLRIAAAGICLAIHFGAWIGSLAYTSVASSVALVSSHPLWIALAGFLLFGERSGRLTWTGIALAMTGAAIILWGDRAEGSGPAPLLGNGLAILGALGMAGYILLARATRAAIGTLGYVWLVYAIAAVALAAAAGASASLFDGVSAAALGYVLAMAIGPQLIGHTAINYAARHLQPTLVSVTILGEPVLAAGLAWVLLAESIAPLELCGFAITLVGIACCACDRRAR